MFLQSLPHDAELLLVTSPSAYGARMRRLAHLYRAGRRHGCILFVELQAGIFPGQLKIIDDGPRIRLRVSGSVFVCDVQELTREAFTSERH